MKAIHLPLNTRTGATHVGFTLLELMVVITVIALLSAIAFPAYQGVVGMARRTAAVAQVKQILIGLRSYAMDHGGRFPGGENRFGAPILTSNDAFRDVLEYMDDDERSFAVSGSAWGPKADNKVDPPSEMLRPGENHFAYISGLTADDRSIWPIVVDGTNGNRGYSTLPGEPGGLWKGKHAIVGRIDGSAEAVRLAGEGDERFIPRHDAPEANALDVERYMGSRVRLLDPELP